MKKRFLPFSLLLVIMILGQSVMADGGHYVPRVKETTSAEAYLSSMRVNQHTGLIDPAWMIAASKKSVANRDEAPVYLYWLTMGPDNLGGKTTSIVYNKENAKEVYIGSMGGGVFRTTNGISWHQVGNNLMVSCMEQAADGTIYVGTGDGCKEFENNDLTNIGYTNSFVGSGIYTIKKNEMSKEPISGTDPKEDDAWSFVNDIAFDADNVVAATEKGLRYRPFNSDQGWAYAMTYDTADQKFDSITGIVLKVKNIKDDNFVVSVDGKVYTGKLNNLKCRSALVTELYDTLGVITHVAPAPADGIVDVTVGALEDGNTAVYAALIDKNGKNTKIYCSRDMGEHWSVILPSADTYSVYGGKGQYNHSLVVDPNNLNRVYVLGADLWRMDKPAGQSGGFYLAIQYTSNTVMHGMNDLEFEPNSDSQRGYLATDGGIYKFKTNADGGFTFENCNRNYTSTRCLNVIPTGDIARVAAGVLDHGEILIKGLANTNNLGTSEVIYPSVSPITVNPNTSAPYSESYLSGSGAASMIRPDVFILTVNGGLQRTESAGDLYDATNFTDQQGFTYKGFRMPIALWECFDDADTPEQVWFKCTQDQEAGDTVQCFSHNGDYPFKYKLPQGMTYHADDPIHSDSLLVHDPVTAKLFAPNVSGTKHKIYVTFDALQFDKVADWYQIAEIQGYLTCMEISKDGDVMFLGTKEGKLYRISNLKAVVSDTTLLANNGAQLQQLAQLQEITLPVTQCITSIAIYNKDNNKVVVTLGNYGNDSYVLYSDNATDSIASFEPRQGRLQQMPVYSSVYTAYEYRDKFGDYHCEEHVLIGTEHGVYITDKIAANDPGWVAADNMMGDVPVLHMKQQNLEQDDQKVTTQNDTWMVGSVVPGIHNKGMIYAATYGRGLFRCETYHQFYSGDGVEENVTVAQSKVTMYPNPVRDAAKVSFELNENTSVSYQVFDMSGRMVKSENVGNCAAGKHEIDVTVDRLAKGAYLLRLNAGSQSSCAKFMVF